jgi:hypothetical protein
VFVIPFSILWCGFAVFWTVGARESGAPLLFWAFGLIFVGVGVYFVIGRFFHDAKMRQHTWYGITNERVLILSGMYAPKLKSLNLRTLSDLTLEERSGGSGTITFGPTGPWDGRPSGMSWPGMGRMQSPQFDCIESVQSVYDALRDAQKRT